MRGLVAFLQELVQISVCTIAATALVFAVFAAIGNAVEWAVKLLFG